MSPHAYTYPDSPVPQLPNHNGKFQGKHRPLPSTSEPSETTTETLLSVFIRHHDELQAYRAGAPVTVDGDGLSLAGVIASSRYGASVELDSSEDVREGVNRSMRAISDKLSAGKSVYGISTGFGGSANTRTNEHYTLGQALLQMQNCGVLPNFDTPSSHDVLPALDELSGTSMPESWVRAAIVIRINSLIRGHSGVRWLLLDRMADLLRCNITPLVPLRGSISASGDLSPLSYIAGTLVGNPAIRVFSGPREYGVRKIVPSSVALKEHNLHETVFHPKEALGILNGTAFSAATATIALHDSISLALLSQVLTAMAHEALLGAVGSHDPFIHDVARPHPGQVECAANIRHLLDGSSLVQRAEEEVSIEEDKGTLRQDRYSLRTAPQFIGPQLEDMLHAAAVLTQECNSTTDNPLVDGSTGQVHHGGNFQAMAVTNAMEKTRLALHHLGKILFAQSTELLDPAFNRGLPPSAASTEPSLNYYGKGIDIATAAYVSELGYLANPVSTHIQSAEMHNQSVNSLALISARQTIVAADVLTTLAASYLLMLCQSLDIRALQSTFAEGFKSLVRAGVDDYFTESLPNAADRAALSRLLLPALLKKLDETSTMDAESRMVAVVDSSSSILLDYFTSLPSLPPSILTSVTEFRTHVSRASAELYDQLRYEFLSGARGPTPASSYLGNTKPLYEFVRVKLGVRMHGLENYEKFTGGFSHETTGQSVSRIYEAIRRGDVNVVMVGMFRQMVKGNNW